MNTLKTISVVNRYAEKIKSFHTYGLMTSRKYCWEQGNLCLTWDLNFAPRNSKSKKYEISNTIENNNSIFGHLLGSLVARILVKIIRIYYLRELLWIVSTDGRLLKKEFRNEILLTSFLNPRTILKSSTEKERRVKMIPFFFNEQENKILEQSGSIIARKFQTTTKKTMHKLIDIALSSPYVNQAVTDQVPDMKLIYDSLMSNNKSHVTYLAFSYNVVLSHHKKTSFFISFKDLHPSLIHAIRNTKSKLSEHKVNELYLLGMVPTVSELDLLPMNKSSLYFVEKSKNKPLILFREKKTESLEKLTLRLKNSNNNDFLCHFKTESKIQTLNGRKHKNIHDKENNFLITINSNSNKCYKRRIPIKETYLPSCIHALNSYNWIYRRYSGMITDYLDGLKTISFISMTENIHFWLKIISGFFVLVG
eukprot:gnl/TRDRNA2_/TRDRNA2_176867_c4_seq1.p1 gnl/TRDRNA2_/TRDRNA2_176867_c4~~gnl/TRDRNA2_/TRDRNA2_176867_c4_seq1.p1  ORF type:complete len:422 (-),score=-42.82 gnl/TRDRNA2_/TRDRNA2_176867_c4_seq1:208-1473(-)